MSIRAPSATGKRDLVIISVIFIAVILSSPRPHATDREEPQSIEDRLQSLQNTISACCETKSYSAGDAENLTMMVKLRLKVEELEVELKELKAKVVEVTRIRKENQ